MPNDEQVSKEFGKKIFAFNDKILQSIQNRPKMKIDYEVFGQDFMQKYYHYISNKEVWNRVYDILTIGHEYGHTLWLDDETEVKMNKSGEFKNIEEFKATTGGLVAFFLEEDDSLWEFVLLDHIKRSIKLISWMEVDEVKPYFCEALIHLQALFDSSILKFENQKLEIVIDEEKYNKLKQWYLDVYKKLATFYLNKENAKEFLYFFLKKEKKTYLPKQNIIKSFIQYYYNLYQKIGRTIK